jgi:hypothetical protein
MENAKNVCHDCGVEIAINDELIENGVSLTYDNAGEKINVLKCNDCYAKNPALTNFQKCEVYSRVVGYIRPVQQWHKGKQQEYGERREFAMPGEEACGC